MGVGSMGYMRKVFIAGLLFWLPIWVTLLVISFIVELLGRSLSLLPHHTQTLLLSYQIPGIGVILTILVIFFTGIIVSNYLGGKVVGLGDSVMARIPLVRSIYAGVKQVTETMFQPGGQSFRKVLLVEYPHKGCWTVAFQTGDVTQEIESMLGGEKMISCYVPTTPNPTSGFLLMKPKSEVKELNISVEQALKFVISLGVIQPGSKPKT
jgi:uncharacterized membrane protein